MDDVSGVLPCEPGRDAVGSLTERGSISDDDCECSGGAALYVSWRSFGFPSLGYRPTIQIRRVSLRYDLKIKTA